MIKAIKELIGRLTLPKDAVEIYGDIWLECYPTISQGFKFESPYSNKPYMYKWKKLKQNKIGVWVVTQERLYSDYHHGYDEA